MSPDSSSISGWSSHGNPWRGPRRRLRISAIAARIPTSAACTAVRVRKALTPSFRSHTRENIQGIILWNAPLAGWDQLHGLPGERPQPEARGEHPKGLARPLERELLVVSGGDVQDHPGLVRCH